MVVREIKDNKACFIIERKQSIDGDKETVLELKIKETMLHSHMINQMVSDFISKLDRMVN